MEEHHGTDRPINALSGLAALRLIWNGMGGDFRAFAVLACFACVMGPVGGQTAWMLRPFLGRPAQEQVPFLRHRESSFLDAVSKSAATGAGVSSRGADESEGP